MRRILAVVGGLLAVSMWTLAAAPPPDKKFETKMGTVTFSHQAHEKAGVKCADCHHKGEGKACTECHGKEVKDGAPTLKDAFHGKGKFSCMTCHAKQEKAPKKCTECHKKA